MSPLIYDFVAALALLIISGIVGSYLARRFRMPDYGWKFSVILFSILATVAILVTRWPPGLGIDLRGGVILIYEIDPTKHDPSQQVDMEQLVTAITRRVNPGGQREVTVRQYGADQIEIIIPQAEQAELDRIKRIISQTGSLEFRILCNDRDHRTILDMAEQNPQARELYDSQGNRLAWWVPVERGQEADFAGPGWETATSGKGSGDTRWRTVTDEQGKKTLQVLVHQDPYDVKGDYLVDVRPGWDRRGRPCVEFTFNTTGAQLFSRLTGDHVPDEVSGFRRRLGIILNGALYSAPNIESTIYDRGEITGNFTKQEVDDLVRVLKAGQLPAALTQQPTSELVTGPTLGEDLIRRGAITTLLSIILIFLFMGTYYRVAGLVACTAMLMNLAMVLALMITIHAEITLSGFAGLVLGVGMAVDANVLIYERMREELERGAALRMAIRNGFHRAMSAIIDSNLTTLITAVVLYVVGTDQIKGFAITLLLGVLLSLYTGVFCARVVFDLMERQGWITQLRMLRMLGRTDINFLGAKYVAVSISGLLILIGLIGVWARGSGLFNIDFTGGVSVEVVFNQPQDIREIRRILGRSDGGLPDLAVSDVKLLNEPKGLRFIINTSIQPPTDPQTGQPLLNPQTGQPYTAVDWVEEVLVREFGDKLASNSLSIQSVELIAAATPSAKVTPQPTPLSPKVETPPPAKPEPSPGQPEIPSTKSVVPPEGKTEPTPPPSEKPKPTEATPPSEKPKPTEATPPSEKPKPTEATPPSEKPKPTEATPPVQAGKPAAPPAQSDKPAPNPDVPLEKPDLQKPEPKPDLQNPDLQKPDLQNPDMQKPDLEKPNLEKPDLQKPEPKPENSKPTSPPAKPSTPPQPESPSAENSESSLPPQQKSAQVILKQTSGKLRVIGANRSSETILQTVPKQTSSRFRPVSPLAATAFLLGLLGSPSPDAFGVENPFGVENLNLTESASDGQGYVPLDWTLVSAAGEAADGEVVSDQPHADKPTSGQQAPKESVPGPSPGSAKVPPSPAPSGEKTEERPPATPAVPEPTKPAEAPKQAPPVESAKLQPGSPSQKMVEPVPPEAPKQAIPPSPSEPKAPPPSPSQPPSKPDPFVGGTRAQLEFQYRIDSERLKALFEEVLQETQTGAVALELANPEYAPGISTAFTHWEVKLALPPPEAQIVLNKVKERIQKLPYFPSSSEIGGKVAGGTRRQAVAALLVSIFFIIVYIWVRFQRVVYGLAAVVALIHDVAITLGAVALTYWLAPILGFLLIDEMKIGLDVLAAFLTLIGYSLNDTIVIFDRIREVKGKAPGITEEMINRSVNDTLARTIITGGGVIMGLLVLYILGGEGIHAFAFTMLFGVVTGTFSSIYIASPILLWLAGLSGEIRATTNSSTRP